MIGVFELLFIGVVFVVIAMIIGGILFHSLVFGTLFYKVTKHVSRTLDESSMPTAGGGPKGNRTRPVCGYCGGVLAAVELACPNCGAPQQRVDADG